jgi:HSP20 family protein
MTLVKFHPAPKFINGWMDNILNEFSAPLEKNLNSTSFRPSVNIKETPDAYHLELSAPGRTKEDFRIDIDKNLLTISCERKVEENNEKYMTKEFTLQPFKRSFTLDDKIEPDNIKARYENGVLGLELPKREETKVVAKKITVE